jgi:hypothetical protein
MDLNYNQVFNQSIQRDIKNTIPNLFKEEALTYHGSLFVFSIKSSSNRKRMPAYTRCSVTNANFRPSEDLRAENPAPKYQNPLKKKPKENLRNYT